MAVCRSQKRLSGGPAATHHQWHRTGQMPCAAVSGAGQWLPAGHDGMWCAGQDGTKALPDTAAPVLGFYLLLHHRLVSFRWWQACEIFQELQHLSPLKLGRAEDRGAGLVGFFSCFRLLFACFFSPESAQLSISGWFLPSRNSYEMIGGFEGPWDASVFWVLIT